MAKNVIEQSLNWSVITETDNRLIVATAIILKNQGEEIALLSCDRNIPTSELLDIVW